ncbi:acylneuraminate cytidylyltransferase family protein [Flavobacteriaceae bacterium PRS1]|nr:acylneuraminate cytidylyltransferase family protein [Flavobacteriaceae bacterium PRS1]
MKYKILAIIPARGGSKGVPRKNLFSLNNKPLIYYSIEASLSSDLITHSIVSTDDEEIQQVAKSYGADAPFLRPSELASDSALAVPTIQHSIIEAEKHYKCKFDYVIMLQPTAPLRTSKDIDESLSILIKENADGIISIVDVDNFHPMKMKVIKNKLLYDFNTPPTENPPRQSLPEIFIVNGAIYASKREVIMNKSSFKGDFCLPFIMPAERSVNIDNYIDFKVAEYYLTH